MPLLTELSQSRFSVGSAERDIDRRSILFPEHRLDWKIWIELVFSEPSRIEQAGLVFVSGIAEHGYNGLAGTRFLRKADCAGNVDPRGQTEEEAFIAEQLVN